jgi:hypothetical protein
MAIKLVKFHDPLDTTKDKKIFAEFARESSLTPKKNQHNLIVTPHKKYPQTSIRKTPST